MHSRIAAVLLGLAAAACAVPAVRDARSERLDALFSELATAKDEARARQIEKTIQATWQRSGVAEVDAAMADAIREARDYNYEAALAILDDLAQAYPRNSEVWNQRATVRFFAGNLDGSLEDIERALALEPRHFGALAGKALILLQRTDRAS